MIKDDDKHYRHRDLVDQTTLPTNGFSINSIHLNKAGYHFGMLVLNDKALEDIPDVFAQFGPAFPPKWPVHMPMWLNEKDSTDSYITVILGSEPKIGEEPERKIMRRSFDKMVVAEGRDGGSYFDIWEAKKEEE
tara:strand:- start:727 stop:1128 length:402 start_codon:yes stop_codon:yes gene_type:complete